MAHQHKQLHVIKDKN